MNIFTIYGKNYDSNIFVILGKNTSIVDTGTGFYSKDIITNIKKSVDPKKIRHILLTHEHYDHVGGVLDILRSTKGNAQILAHKNAFPKLKRGESSFAQMLGGTMPKIDVDMILSDNERIILGDEEFDVLYTPGHSSGSICFYCKDRKLFISGDTIFAHGGFGRYDFRGGDFNSLYGSIKRLTTLDVLNLYPGHGPIIETFGNDHVMKSFKSIRSLI